MEARELRVGSKVNLNGADVTVKTIEYNQVSEEYFIRVFEDYRQIKVNYLSPIPITEESIKKLPTDLGSIEIIVSHDGKIIVSVPTTSAEGWTEELRHIKAIHQLQNLYFALTGTELTFK